TRVRRSLMTCLARVGEIPVDRLALGAAIGRPASRISHRATAVEGTRTPTVSWPAVTMSGMIEDRGRTIVSGPGQKRSASLPARSGQVVTHSRAWALSARWTIKGFDGGRPLAWKIRATAAGLVASAPSP